MGLQLHKNTNTNPCSESTLAWTAEESRTMTTKSKKIKCLQVCSRLVYFAGLLLLVSLLLLQTAQCLRQYFLFPTYFSSVVVGQEDVEFPAATVCPEEQGFNETILQVWDRNQINICSPVVHVFFFQKYSVSIVYWVVGTV